MPYGVKLKEFDENHLISKTLYLTEPEVISNKKMFTFLKKGDKIKLDPEEVESADSFKGRVDLDMLFTVVSCSPKIKKTNNPSNWQLLKLDKKVTVDEDSTGWSNSYFVMADSQ